MKATVSIYLFLCLCGLSFSFKRIHFYVPQGMQWNDAQMYCRKHYYDLSTTTTQERMEISSNHKDSVYVWVGAYLNPLNSSEWIWSGGEKEPVENWSFEEPNNLGNEKCALLITPNLINDRCDATHSFYCMDYFEPIVVHENKTWEEALDYCRQNYVDLVSITSEWKMVEVIKNITTSQTAYVWTGLRFLSEYWFWVSGDDVEYKAWSTEGELQCPPRNLKCGALDIVKKVWKPTDCEERLNFVCIKN
ncbi:putative C-type lectin domain family 20 member A [Misgurnus anguillicaudatus]|uniref:putative C-type lectin domain family 20 member A n=1 Tax=Misgurnus anguillicaudatus TaxID=75329 RepID=UPI003CCFAE13